MRTPEITPIRMSTPGNSHVNPQNETKIMDFTVGDTLILKAEAFDETDPSKVLYPAGTVAVIEQVFENMAYLRFPNAEIVPHTPLQLFMFFDRKVNGNLVYRRETTGLGTPPKELAHYLPKECDWKRNYRFKVTIEVEDRGLKVAACPKCYTDLDGSEVDDKGLFKCKPCGMFVLPINPSTFEYPEN